MQITEKISADFLYSSDTFVGVYIASNEILIESEDSFVETAEKFASNMVPNEPMQIIRRYEDNGVLKPRVNIALLTTFEGEGEDYTDKCLTLVWFDDDDMCIEQSLTNIEKEIDWSLGREFEF